MILKKFSVSVLIRTAAICITSFVLVFLLTRTSFVATPFIVGLLLIGQIFSLIGYVQKTNKDLARFFDSIKYSDFSQNFRSVMKGSAFDELNRAFSEVMDRFRETRAEKEEHYRYLQIVVQHVGIGLMAFTADGDVELVNAGAKRLLRVNDIRNISDLSIISQLLSSALEQIHAGESKLVKFVNDNELFQLSIYATEFRMRDRQYKLVSLTNIQNELEEREMEAWQNLIRVLTHEIMNSITPIISLSSTANMILAAAAGGEESGGGVEAGADRNRKQGNSTAGPEANDTVDGLDSRVVNVPASDLRDIKGALETIEKRSNGLLHFVDDYRNLTRVPTPHFQTIKAAEVLARVEKLFAERMKLRGIRCSIEVNPPQLELTADPDLIEQVMINLVMNSIGALSGTPSPEIRLAARTDNRGSTLIQVADNGHGIPEELQDKIFIPFFTTRKEGSGIGLSLSRQIMRAHKGSITVISSTKGETVFTLRF